MPTVFFVDDLQACEPESLTKDERVHVALSEEMDSMGFPRATVSALDLDILLQYVRENWGDDDATGGWYSEWVVARVQTYDLVEISVMRAKNEILIDIDAGVVPASVQNFSELHDYVDANEYGGLCDDWPSDEALGIKAWLDWGNKTQDAVHAWITDGGLKAALMERRTGGHA